LESHGEPRRQVGVKQIQPEVQLTLRLMVLDELNKLVIPDVANLTTGVFVTVLDGSQDSSSTASPMGPSHAPANQSSFARENGLEDMSSARGV